MHRWCNHEAAGFAGKSARARRGAATARRRAVDHAAYSQREAGVAAGFDRRAGVCRNRRHSDRQSRSCESPHAAAASACGGYARVDGAAVQTLRPCAVDADRRPADFFGRHCRSAKRRPGRGRRRRVLDILRLAELIGIPAQAEIVCPGGGVRPAPAQPYAVIHAAPMFTYKRWTGGGWRALAAALHERGFATAVTGAACDRAYLDDVWRDGKVVRLDGSLDWPGLTALIAGARVYIGPDTAITHLAAATGTPTVALYGPTDPRLWGPWPRGGLERPWAAAGTIQQRGNVWLVQNPLPCLPCQLEGCERRLDSHSQCLDELTAAQVVSAVDQALTMRQAA